MDDRATFQKNFVLRYQELLSCRYSGQANNAPLQFFWILFVRGTGRSTNGKFSAHWQFEFTCEDQTADMSPKCIALGSRRLAVRIRTAI